MHFPPADGFWPHVLARDALVAFMLLAALHTGARGTCPSNIVNVRVTAEPQVLTSPGYPQEYASRLRCQWRLSVEDPWMVVQVEVLDLDVAGETTMHEAFCEGDYLAFHDGRSKNVPLGESHKEWRWCQGERSGARSYGPDAVVTFHSNADLSGRGFKLLYYSVSPGPMSECYDTSVVTVNITAAPFYFDFPPREVAIRNQKCSWQFNGAPGTVLAMELVKNSTLASFGCDENWSSYTIRDGLTKRDLLQECQNAHPFDRLVFSGNMAEVVLNVGLIGSFETHSYWTFKFIAETVNNTCSQEPVMLGSLSTYLMYPHQRDASGAPCPVQVQADNPQHTLRVAVLQDLNNTGNHVSCSRKYIQASVRPECWRNSTPEYRLIASSMSVEPRAPYADHLLFLQLSSLPYPCNGQVKVLKANHTHFQHYEPFPGHKFVMPDNADCRFVVEAEGQDEVVAARMIYVLHSSLSSDGCQGDWAAVHDGDTPAAPLLDRWCGWIHPTYVSSGRRLLVDLTTDDRHQPGTGFVIRYWSLKKDASCYNSDVQLKATEEVQYILSPGYPDYYPLYSSCSWTITADPDYTLTVTVLEMTVKKRCKESLNFYDDAGTTVTHVVCDSSGVNKNFDFAKSVKIVFSGDNSKTTGGFKLAYVANKLGGAQTVVGGNSASVLGARQWVLLMSVSVTFALIAFHRRL